MSSQPDACERLAQSREHLRQALQQVSISSSDGDGSGTDGLLSDVLANWWGKQPLRLVLQLALEAAKVLMQPVARRHPYKLVLGAAAAGGLLVLLRPWRWTSTRALAAGLLPQIMSLVIARDRHDSRR
jgi:hypothetical protein